MRISDFIGEQVPENTKHIVKNKEADWTKEQYEQEGKKLASTPCDYKNILGYVAQDKQGKRSYCKYDKRTELFTVYVYQKDQTSVITSFKRSWREFQGKMYDANQPYEYVDEIPPGK